MLYRTMMVEELVKLGCIKGGFETKTLVEKNLDRVFMPHSLGHYIGLYVHDVGMHK